MWLGPAPLRPYSSILSPRGVHDNYPDWRKYRDYGSGFIGDWGAHHFDIVQWAMGMDHSGPVEFLPPGDHAARVGARYRYENGVEVIHVPGGGITFIGENGRIFVDRGAFKLWLGNNGGKLKTDDRGECDQMLQEYLPANAVRLYKSDNQLADFLACVRSRKLPICDVEIGQRSATTCNLMALTYYHGQKLKWNPAKEKFTEGTGKRELAGARFPRALENLIGVRTFDRAG